MVLSAYRARARAMKLLRNISGAIRAPAPLGVPWVVGALPCVLAACSNNLDALFETDGGATEVAVPLLPATPDDTRVREACSACAASQCQDARASCLED